jgi:hypothetical protein
VALIIKVMPHRLKNVAKKQFYFLKGFRCPRNFVLTKSFEFNTLLTNLQHYIATRAHREDYERTISSVARNLLVSSISLSLWTCISTSPLARLSLDFSSPPERRQVDLARQTLVPEAFHIRTWLVPCL